MSSISLERCHDAVSARRRFCASTARSPKIPLASFPRKISSCQLGADGEPLIYFAGNSLGLMPKAARKIVEQELDDWARARVDAHLKARTPWYSYHETLREPARDSSARNPNEVICMNSLTVNLHLMMATFYRPTKSRFKILMEEPAFPSDTYAIKTQIVHHGFDPKEALVLARPRKGEFTVRTGRHRSAIRESTAIRLARRADWRGELFHRSVIRHRENHGRGAEARNHRRDRSCPRHRQRSAGIARLERRFRGLVFL